MSDGENHADLDASAAGDVPDALGDLREAAPDAREPVDPRDERIDPDDGFAPPKILCQCYCLHCRRTFLSSEIWFQRVTNARPGDFPGFWMCPTPNCDGKGFTFDIFPTDPDHPANAGWCDDEADYEDDEEWDEDFEPLVRAESAADEEYDPTEFKWRQLDEELEGLADDDDIEGEEWKYGLEPGETFGDPDGLFAGRHECDDEDARYDQPDERPREIELEHREGIDEDDIPF